MNIVVEVIAEYLRTNRRLVVPTFGAFMVKESGERLFSDLLNTDDGVLVALLREKGLSEMESAVLLDRFIFEIRHELEQYGYCRLAELGTLRIEPATKIVRLYPPIHSEVSQQETYEHKQMPYVPQSIAEPKPTEEEILQETPTQQPKQQPKPQPAPETQPSLKEVPKVEKPATHAAKPQPMVAPRKKRLDFVMIVAIVIVAVALVAIGYGWYVSNLAVADDAAMDALRVMPEQINE